MPKTSKRKKQEKTRDFQKKKLKVGKSGITPMSHTNTSFKSRSVHVPVQTIISESRKDNASVGSVDDKEVIQLKIKAKSKLILDHLVKLNHTNAYTRLNALDSIKDTISSDSGNEIVRLAIKSHLNRICIDPLKLILDSDKQIRRGLLSFLADLYKPEKMSSWQISPHFPVVIVYICSAMTHINEHIRADALLFLKLFMERFPELTVKHGSEKLVPVFVQMLSGKEKLSSKSALSNSTSVASVFDKVDGNFTMTQVKLNILQNLCMFLRAYVAAGTTLGKSCTPQQPSVQHLVSTRLNTQLFELADIKNLKNELTAIPIQEIRTRLDSCATREMIVNVLADSMNSLFDLWIDCFETVFTATTIQSSPGNAASIALKTILEIISVILNYLAASVATILPSIREQSVCNQLLSLICRHMLPRFPFGRGIVTNVDKVPALYWDLNLSVASILSALEILNNTNQMDKTNPAEIALEFVTDEFLTNESATAKMTDEQMQTVLCIFQNVMMMRRMVLDKTCGSESDLMNVIMKLATSTRLSWQCRLAAFQFINGPLLTSLISSPNYTISPKQGQFLEVGRYILTLPRLMWELQKTTGIHHYLKDQYDIATLVWRYLSKEPDAKFKSKLDRVMQPFQQQSEQHSISAYCSKGTALVEETRKIIDCILSYPM